VIRIHFPIEAAIQYLPSYSCLSSSQWLLCYRLHKLFRCGKAKGLPRALQVSLIGLSAGHLCAAQRIGQPWRFMVWKIKREAAISQIALVLATFFLDAPISFPLGIFLRDCTAVAVQLQRCRVLPVVNANEK
jgi:hypothetical protein